LRKKCCEAYLDVRKTNKRDIKENCTIDRRKKYWYTDWECIQNARGKVSVEKSA
jgi:hypothetical protein